MYDTSKLRTRWSAIGAAIAISLGAGGIGISHATTSSGERAIYQPINPCRLTDLRPAPNTVGPRSTPLGAGETITLAGWGTVGDCTLPTGTTGLALNVTAVGPTAPTFLRLWPADGAQPSTSNLNPSPGQPPTPNGVNVGLSSTGSFSVFNNAGSVSVIVDVVGVYDDHDHDDRYNTKAQTDAALSSKADSSNVYTKAQTDAALTTKANTSDIYTKIQTDAAIAAAATGFDRIVVVSGAGTDLDNGTALLAAINTVDLATPSAADPWTIMLEPGVYATTVPVVLSAGVSLIGTNQNGTTVTCACVSSSNGVVTVNGTSTVSGLSISNTSLDSTNARGLFVDGSDVLIDHVTITTAGDDGIDVDTNVIDVRVESVEVFAADAAIDAGGSTAVRVNNSYLSSQGFEVLQLSSGALSATVTNSTIEQLAASDTGINIQGTTTPVVLEICHSRIITNGSPAWLENASNTATIHVSNSYIYAGTKIGAGAAVPVCVLIAGPATGSLSSCP